MRRERRDSNSKNSLCKLPGICAWRLRNSRSGWLESGERGDRGENEDRDNGKSNDVGPVDHVQALDVIFTV